MTARGDCCFKRTHINSEVRALSLHFTRYKNKTVYVLFLLVFSMQFTLYMLVCFKYLVLLNSVRDVSQMSVLFQFLICLYTSVHANTRHKFSIV